jgi:hypothetical protein
MGLRRVDVCWEVTVCHARGNTLPGVGWGSPELVPLLTLLLSGCGFWESRELFQEARTQFLEVNLRF